MKKFITAFLLAVFGISFFCSTAVPASAAVQPTASIVADGIYYIRNQRSGLYLDVYNNGTENNTQVQQSHYNGDENQRFKLKRIISDVYEIVPLHANNMRLDVYNGNTTNETPVNIYTSNSGDAQRFRIVSTGNGDNSFKILTAVSNYTKCITPHYASMDPVEIIQYTYGNDGNEDNDHWYFEDITLNEKTLVHLAAGQTKTFEITIPDNKYYAVETMQFGSFVLDTYLTVSNLSTGNAYDDNSGEGAYSFICFNNQGGRNLTISVRLRDSSASGSFYLQIRRQKAVFYGFQYSDINTIQDLTVPYNVFCNLYNSHTYANKDASHFLEIDERGCNRCNSEIMFFAGHGSEDGGHISFNNKVKFELSGLNKNMSNVRFAVWAACCTASTDNSYNTSFVDRAVSNGAKSSLGFPDPIGDKSARTFTNYLFQKLSEGYTVGDAASYAASKLIWSWDAVKNYRIAGSSSITLTTPNYTKNSLAPSQNSTQENYYNLINNNEYVAFDNGDTIRYYLTINGIISNQFVDVAKAGVSQQAFVAQNYNVSDNITVLPTLCEYDTTSTSTEEKHIVYIVENNIATPVLISYVTVTEENGDTYLDVICRNLSNGEYIDYEEICTVPETESNVCKS